MEDLDILVKFLRLKWADDKISILGNSIGTRYLLQLIVNCEQKLTKDRVWASNPSRCPRRLSFQQTRSHIALHQLLRMCRVVLVSQGLMF